MNNELMHYGIPGMRWGKGRKSPMTASKFRDNRNLSKSSSVNNKSRNKKNKHKVAKALGKVGKTSISVANTMIKNPLAEEAKKTANYVTLASQMSPEYRRRFMYR